MNVLSLILISVLCNTVGQVLLKEGMLRIGEISYRVDTLVPVMLQITSSPFVIGGLFCYGMSLSVWLLVLSRADLSYAYPMVSMGYILTTVAAYFFLHEAVTPMRMLGTVIIIFGVLVMARA